MYSILQDACGRIHSPDSTEGLMSEAIIFCVVGMLVCRYSKWMILCWFYYFLTLVVDLPRTNYLLPGYIGADQPSIISSPASFRFDERSGESRARFKSPTEGQCRTDYSSTFGNWPWPELIAIVTAVVLQLIQGNCQHGDAFSSLEKNRLTRLAPAD